MVGDVFAVFDTIEAASGIAAATTGSNCSPETAGRTAFGASVDGFVATAPIEQWICRCVGCRLLEEPHQQARSERSPSSNTVLRSRVRIGHEPSARGLHLKQFPSNTFRSPLECWSGQDQSVSSSIVRPPLASTSCFILSSE